MTTRPQALMLADEIDPLTRYSLDNLTCSAAAHELRRLHNEILVYHDDRLKLSNEVDRLRAALGLIASLERKPADKPVAWMNILEDGYKCITANQIPNWTPLYTHPQPKREPLTLGQKQRLWSKVAEKPTLKDRVNAFGLEIEAAHGITRDMKQEHGDKTAKQRHEENT